MGSMQVDETFHIAPLAANESGMPGCVGPLSLLKANSGQWTVNSEQELITTGLQLEAASAVSFRDLRRLCRVR